MQVLGIDIGGSGIKGAPVDIASGELVQPRFRIPTPQPSKPEAVARVVAEIVDKFEWEGQVGCTFPAVVQHGVVHSAANVDASWIGTDADELFEKQTGLNIHVLNDADAAGICEMRFGAGKDHDGVVMILTFGTGIGSAIFNRGILLPNTELGHLEIRGKDAEDRASDRAREQKEYSWPEWMKRVNEVLARIEALFSPDLLIFGGGVSKHWDEFEPLFKTRAPIVRAQFKNEAGIVGAALAAHAAFGDGEK
jgi:polyphosphate glucokinase